MAKQQLTTDAIDPIFVNEAARLLRVSTATIYTAVQNGQLPCRRLGGKAGKIILGRQVVKNWLGETQNDSPTAA